MSDYILLKSLFPNQMKLAIPSFGHFFKEYKVKRIHKVFGLDLSHAYRGLDGNIRFILIPNILASGHDFILFFDNDFKNKAFLMKLEI